MSTAATVPMFDPNGTLRDVPYERMHDAIAAGGKPGVRMKAPDGQIRVIPADKTQQAAKAGGTLLPIQDQEVNHPGFWTAVAEDAVPALKGVGVALLGPAGLSYLAMKQGLDELRSVKATGKTIGENQNAAEKLAGYGALYRRVAVPAARAVGVNVSGMEASAEQGDVAGVLGHTAVPAVAAVAPLAAEGAIRAIGPANAGKILKTGVVAGKVGAKVADIATFDRLSKAAEAIKSTVGSVREIWKTPDLVYPGANLPENPGVFPGASLPATPPPEVLQAQSLANGGKAAPPSQASALRTAVRPVYPGASLPATPAAEVLNPSLVSPARTLPGQIGPEVVRPPAPPVQPIPTRSGLMLPESSAPPEVSPAPVTPKAIERGPQPMQGESALRHILTGQDNANLLKIAKSRGINVAKESLLKAGSANKLIIDKIVDHFTPEELDDLSAQYMENSRFKHAFGDIGPEAQQTLALQAYFPEMKIPAATLKRAQSSIDSGKTASAVLTDLLKKSVEAAQKKKAQAAP